MTPRSVNAAAGRFTWGVQPDSPTKTAASRPLRPEMNEVPAATRSPPSRNAPPTPATLFTVFRSPSAVPQGGITTPFSDRRAPR